MKNNARILITGDVYLGSDIIEKYVESRNFKEIFGDLYNIIKSTDLAIANLESPLIDHGVPLPKTGPNLKSSTQNLKILKEAGFNLLTLANNHIMDYGVKGLEQTLKTCKKLQISTVGAGLNNEVRTRTFKNKINGIKFGIINIAENEFITSIDGSAGAHPLNTIKNYYKIKETKEEVDYVVLIIHGGHENYKLPSPRMKETYRYFIDVGADIVIGHHTHCTSGYEIYKDKLISYGLGNFIFVNKKRKDKEWNSGKILEVEFSKSGYDFKYTPYIYNHDIKSLKKLNYDEIKNFENKLNVLNDIIKDDVKLNLEFRKLCKDKEKNYMSYIVPYSNRYLHMLRRNNIFPSFISNNKRLLLLNLVRCESHRDILIKTLEP